MHIDRTHQVAMTDKAARFAPPHTALGFMSVAARRTPAGGSPLRSGEARHARQLTLVTQVRDVLAVFPLRHPLIVLASSPLCAHPIRTSYIEGGNLMRPAEIHHLARPFVAHVANPAFGSKGISPLGRSQALGSL